MSEESASLVQYRMEQADAALNDAKYLLDGNRGLDATARMGG